MSWLFLWDSEKYIKARKKLSLFCIVPIEKFYFTTQIYMKLDHKGVQVVGKQVINFIKNGPIRLATNSRHRDLIS